jgi:serine/threonine protein phosphatase PrpC
MHNNSFPGTSYKQQTKNMTQQATQSPRRKWATFTYVEKVTHHITNIFRHTDIQIAFRTNNTIQNLLTHRNPNPDKFSSSGVYKLTCPECGKAYVGQTGDASHYATRSTDVLSTATPHHPVSHNTSSTRHTPSAPSTKSCKYYITIAKAPISTPSKNSTSTPNTQTDPT